MLFFEIPHFFRYFWLGEESQSENRTFFSEIFFNRSNNNCFRGDSVLAILVDHVFF